MSTHGTAYSNVAVLVDAFIKTHNVKGYEGKAYGATNYLVLIQLSRELFQRGMPQGNAVTKIL